MAEECKRVERHIQEGWSRCINEDPTQLKVQIKPAADQSPVLPPFPITVRSILLTGFHIETLPALPEGIEEIICNSCCIENLPPLPEGLTKLVLNNNCLKSLPPLPSTLQCLYLHNNEFKSLPPLPPSLKELGFAGNGVHKFPNLPPALEKLWVSLLDTHTTLPSSLKQLRLMLAGDFSKVPELPPTIENLQFQDFYDRYSVIPTDIASILESQELRRKRRAVDRCKAIKEELIAAVWHPRRMEFWSAQE